MIQNTVILIFLIQFVIAPLPLKANVPLKLGWDPYMGAL